MTVLLCSLKSSANAPVVKSRPGLLRRRSSFRFRCVLRLLHNHLNDCEVPYILAYKSQNLQQNHAPKVRGGDLSAGHKIKKIFHVPKYAISNVPVTNNQYLQLFVLCHVTYGRTWHWAVGLRKQDVSPAEWRSPAKCIIAHEALCRHLS